MADEIVGNEGIVDPANAPKGAEPSEVEIRAREMGWIPKEEYEGDETVWLDAGEFVRRRPLFEKIDKQNRELKEIKRTVQMFAQHHAKVKEAEYQRALDTLKAQKVAAFEEGDAKKIVNIDDQIEDVKKEQKQFEAEQAQQVREEARQIHPEFEAWTNRNPWYTTSPEMKAFADVVGAKAAGTPNQDGSKKSPAEVLKEVEKRVREEFSHRFMNKNREKPGAVEGASKPNGKANSEYVPNDYERRAAAKFVKQKLFASEAEYYKELQKLNGKS